MYNKKLLSKIDLGKFTKSDPYKNVYTKIIKKYKLL